VDIDGLLDGGAVMAAASREDPSAGNAPFTLGAVLGELAAAGRDKATFLTSSSLAALPPWLEQLIAESTGKDGTGILPVAGEPVGRWEAYGDDRVFVYLAADGDDDAEQAAAVSALEAAGHPVIRITAGAGTAGLAAEMMRAEVAVAMAGSVLGIHPFDQPNVQLAKQLAKDAMAGRLDAGDIPEVHAQDKAALAAALGEFLAGAGSGDYVGVQAFVAPTTEAEALLQKGRLALRDRLGVATTLGFGPRFLHSTGQLHKGGANTGLFVQVVDSPSADVPVPGESYTFGELIAGQADGDYQALVETGRRVIRVQAGRDADRGLANLAAAMKG
jgi:transaldolase/glucose-6-phosphate isomerase